MLKYEQLTLIMIKHNTVKHTVINMFIISHFCHTITLDSRVKEQVDVINLSRNSESNGE